MDAHRQDSRKSSHSQCDWRICGSASSANWALANELADEGQAGLHIGIINVATIAGAAGKMLGPGIDALNRYQGNRTILDTIS
ncbi:MAG: hypothetical protein CM1200mP22_30830 [Dehalococcoidia bacterium]|nr:MAG: hypothetical protein CM1200mP22_30830 [Dehalococcoidia bacterium]